MNARRFYRLATTRRTHSTLPPLEHAGTSRPYSRTGSTWTALCGRQIRPFDRSAGPWFDPLSARACRDCARLTGQHALADPEDDR